MLTPSETRKIREAAADAVASLLARESNEGISAETLADEISEAIVETVINTYEEIQAKSYNLIVLGHFRLEDDTSYVAAVGPLSTRAPARARGVGERFAWDYKTRKGTGRYVLVPLIRDPAAAWDHLRAEQRPPESVRGGLERATALADDPFGPTCICGLPEHPRYNSLGDAADLICPRHPEGRSGDS